MTTTREHMEAQRKRARRFDELEFGGHTYHFRSLTELEAAEWQARVRAADRLQGEPFIRARSELQRRLLVLVLCEPGGAPVYQDNEWPLLDDLDAALSAVLFDAGIVHAGLDGGGAGLAKLLGNSTATHDDETP